ncbi:MAG: hypothetical protein A2504_01310 [Bdellovibrionales bacterium RIFOXYD12_FULL_39_22]|nr:MAG: hypothetical protein A2385_02200 [Bdellovibrionales bacterium RIFOXYB1_FULL_39_21]OFZ42746.1 MAG: hypothetical protein A2485_10385 [Bdellovibrionales bacterium RIFOXYC12_FULL_39_17]OFZ47305.1 MAG: hypothetical protein A2404_14990 [Bdellovibrionales bacterium RIFOXYC1_FULL_39_130]OFZ75471.1 MAG: hypothetical protein A2560_04260 [Bdellovibrionales bacterium RIFOXYD1_FULL_39_84]OFZ93425.1 MAG: hypothetical protein A2504_01310 [Bdellovibrionales bacterium RIFOXYD12_FULL_39_22]HLE12398.1 hy
MKKFLLKKFWMDLWSRSLPVLVFMFPSIIGGGIVGAYPGYKIYEYIWEDADFCTSCHVHDYATLAWQKSSHGKLTTCHDCHHQPLIAYAMEPLIMITHQPKFPQDLDHVPHVPNGLCEACHVSDPHDTSTISGPMAEADIRKLPKVDKTYLHQIHLNAKTTYLLLKDFKIPKEARENNTPIMPDREKGEARSITCSDCHGGPSNRGHNFSAVDSACIRCHNQVHTDSTMVQKFGCRNCHFAGFIMEDITEKALEGIEQEVGAREE